MNHFKYLDNLFPCGDDRAFGEVVSIYAELCRNGAPLKRVAFDKRKAWYVNASVNAWHLHRSLVAQVKGVSLTSGVHVTRSARSAQRRGLRALVAWCYEENHRSGRQQFNVVFDMTTGNWHFQCPHPQN